MSTPGAHATSIMRNCVLPVMYCSGSPFARRTTAACMVSSWSALSVSSMRIYRSMRAKPVAAHSSHSAERRGCSSPRSARYSLVHSRQRLMVQISFAMGSSPLMRRAARECRRRLYARVARGKGRLKAIIENQPRIFVCPRPKCSFVDVHICIRQAFGKVAPKLTNT